MINAKARGRKGLVSDSVFALGYDSTLGLNAKAAGAQMDDSAKVGKRRGYFLRLAPGGFGGILSMGGIILMAVRWRGNLRSG